MYEPDVQHMVKQLAKTWADANSSGVKLYHIPTDGWIHKELTCDGTHPTSEGKFFFNHYTPYLI